MRAAERDEFLARSYRDGVVRASSKRKPSCFAKGDFPICQYHIAKSVQIVEKMRISRKHKESLGLPCGA